VVLGTFFPTTIHDAQWHLLLVISVPGFGFRGNCGGGPRTLSVVAESNRPRMVDVISGQAGGWHGLQVFRPVHSIAFTEHLNLGRNISDMSEMSAWTEETITKDHN
jgi:hypothetical protein